MNDLDWIARHLHKWPDSYNKKDIYAWHRTGDGQTPIFVTYDQWISERARLQNKPKPCDWPIWAEYMAQCSDGEWRWFDMEPTPNHSVWMPKLRWTWTCRGEVLGDWRDTLEKKPEQMTPPIHTNHRCVQVTIENPEWNGEGLPPVGTMCEYISGGNHMDVEILFIDDRTVLFESIQYRGNRWHYKTNDTDFELVPLKTEEEKAIREIENIIYDVWDQGDDEASTIAKAIYEHWVKNQDAAK